MQEKMRSHLRGNYEEKFWDSNKMVWLGGPKMLMGVPNLVFRDQTEADEGIGNRAGL